MSVHLVLRNTAVLLAVCYIIYLVLLIYTRYLVYQIYQRSLAISTSGGSWHVASELKRHILQQ